MKQHWINHNEQDRSAIQAIAAFLNGRLEERATIDWALQLRPHDASNRLALLNVIDSPYGRKLREPWRSAWRLIEESWNNPIVDDHASIAEHNVKHRLSTGERSGSLVKAIVELISPRLEIEAFSDLNLCFQKPPKQPKTVNDLLSARLTSRKPVESDLVQLISKLTDHSFLQSLASALDAAVVSGLDIARRLGWNSELGLWQLGLLYRVYYVPVAGCGNGNEEPDEFHRGFAPSVKLLHEVVARLVDIDISTAAEFVSRWKLTKSPIHLRLWAALSRDSRVTTASEMSDFLLSLNDQCFWDISHYPEIAELRAKRFSELDPHQQAAITARIRKYPPRSQWSRKANASSIKHARLYLAVRELRRIELAGANLPIRDKSWLDTKIKEFPDLMQISRLDEDFLDLPKIHTILPNLNSRYDMLTSAERLKALETDLSSARGVWHDDSAERAKGWIRQPGGSLQILADFESISDGGGSFPRVWGRFGWSHSPSTEQDQNTVKRDFVSESNRVLLLLAQLPVAITRQAIDGISHWLFMWRKQIAASLKITNIWLKLWPVAVEVTNEQQPIEEEINLSTVDKYNDDHKAIDLDTVNAPAGKLVNVFLAMCPNLNESNHPFEINDALRTMRDAIIVTNGRSGLIARYQLIEALPYFLRAAPDWSRKHLLTPLITDNPESIAFWNAVARRTHFSDVLQVIGEQMVERTTDYRLSRETRCSLVWSLVIECLHAFHEQRAPAVSYVRIQQMLRSLDDEVRAHAAKAVQRFVRDISASQEGKQVPLTPEQLFRSAAAPFFLEVWPQEHSLATPGISKALVSLPATAGEAFVQAVKIIERFLVPSECWSLLDYGLFGEKEGIPKLSNINNSQKAEGLLQLLDLTIGTAENSVIPYDLADALEQIRKVAPILEKDQKFRRLATAARRI